MKVQLSHAVRFLVLGAIFFCSCRAAHNVAVSSFRVIDAPANYVRRHIDADEGTTTTTTTTTYQSDVATPGQPVVAASPTQRKVTTRRRASSETDRQSSASNRDSQEPRSKSSSSQRTETAPTSDSKIPYAKPVPGKPGYVYSPFDPNGGYVDVTGYAAGSKAKDPYSGKIFIVP